VSPRPSLDQEGIDDRARRLVEATFEVAARTGDPSPSVRLILQEAGLSRQIFYRCFASRAELMDAVLAEGRRILAEYLRARMERTDNAEQAVRAWITGVMRQAQSAPERTRPFITAPLAPHDVVAETQDALASMLAGAIARGTQEGRWTSTDPAAEATIIHDFVFDAMRRHLLRNERPSRETIQRLGDFAVRALKPIDIEIPMSAR
jgi:AcrR family transcriptional regulator